MILASASPRRSELLEQLGVSFRVEPAAIDEALDSRRTIDEAVAALAERKASAVSAAFPEAVILAADTIVLLDDRVLGKPVDAHDAERMLWDLRGRWHVVITGIAVIDGRGTVLRCAITTRVLMRETGLAEISAYVATGEPLDKAGSYGIQGRGGALVAEIDGCYTNIVGLPLCATADLLRRSGVVVQANRPLCTLPSGDTCPRLMPSRRAPV